MTADASTITLLYHDTYAREPTESGFAGRAADRYKLAQDVFERHLEAIRLAQPVPASSILGPSTAARPTFHLAFDDGGASSLAIADALEKRSMIGHFFIATDYIGKPGFLDEQQIRTLQRRGHVVGSHSCTHPDSMMDMPDADLQREWTESVQRLAAILDAPVTTGSIPCGSYAPRVAVAAGAAGITHLFTSEPTRRLWRIGAVTLIGRYSVVDTTSLDEVARLASGDKRATAMQAVLWNTKRAVRRTIGPLWHVARERLLARREA
ncbi:MAG: polysaccharide deacetylase family protein [Hyphomicrobiaceae bacterium]